MFHVGSLHQAPKVETFPGRRGEVARWLRGEVGVDERGEVGLVGEQGGAGGGGAASQRVALVLRQAVTTDRGVATLRTQTLRLRCSAHVVPTVTLIPATAAAAPPQTDTETQNRVKPENYRLKYKRLKQLFFSFMNFIFFKSYLIIYFYLLYLNFSIIKIN